jgi:hypothetical protein
MSIVFQTKIIVQNAGRLLILACADKNGKIQYDLLNGVINNKDNIQLEIFKQVQSSVHAKVKSCKFLTKMSSKSPNGNTTITLYYLCETKTDVLKLEQKYDSYYWLEIDDIIAQPVLPAWIKGAALLLSSKRKEQSKKADYNQVFITEILTGLGAKKTQRNDSLYFSANNKTFCIIDKENIQLLFDNNIKPDFEYKIITKKGIEWLQTEKSLDNIEKIKPFLKSSFEHAKL